MRDHAGTRLGPYELLDKIGEGGMGEVWKARDTRLNRTVAIKRSSARFSDRFEREAQAIAALNHPHICTLHDVGPDFLVMEYVEGKPPKGPLPVEEALRIGAEIADALDAAHSRGIIHRDLKPSNILLTKSGVKLLDFGLARREETAPDNSSAEMVTKALTGEGAVVGTPQYMSPEQVEGRPADHRSDIFAFGCVLYELLTGVRAFEGKSVTSVIAAILARDPRPAHELQPSVPPALEKLLSACLAKDPDDRWQSARDLKHAIAALAIPAAADSAPRRRPWFGTLGWFVAAVAVIALGIFGFLHWSSRPELPQQVRFGIDVPDKIGAVRNLSVSPDGKWIALVVASQDGRNRIWLRPIDSDQLEPVSGTEGALVPTWSPDSRSFVFVSGGSLKRMDISGGVAQTLGAVNGAVSIGSWSDSGSILLGTFRGPIQRLSAQGGEARPVTRLASGGETMHVWPHFLPDGNRFLYTVYGDRGGSARVGSLDGKTDSPLLLEGGPFLYASPGFILFGKDGAVMAQRFDPDSLRLEGEPARVADSLERSAIYPGVYYFSASLNGVLAWRTAVTSPLRRLVWRDESGAELGMISQPALYTNPALSPEGKRLAIDIQATAGEKRDIWIFDLERGSRMRLVNDQGEDHNPTWSPDGKEIAFTSDRNGTRDIFVKAADGSTAERLLVSLPEWENSEHWSPDGQHLLFNYQPKGGGTTQQIMILALPATQESRPGVLPGSPRQNSAQVSPNGKYLVYVSGESGRNVVQVRTFPDSGPVWQVSTESGMEPQWRRDGKVLYYLDRSRPKAQMMAVDVDTTGPVFKAGRPRRLFEFTATDTRRSSYVAGSENRLLLVEPDLEQPRSPVTVLVNWNGRR